MRRALPLDREPLAHAAPGQTSKWKAYNHFIRTERETECCRCPASHREPAVLYQRCPSCLARQWMGLHRLLYSKGGESTATVKERVRTYLVSRWHAIQCGALDPPSPTQLRTEIAALLKEWRVSRTDPVWHVSTDERWYILFRRWDKAAIQVRDAALSPSASVDALPSSSATETATD